MKPPEPERKRKIKLESKHRIKFLRIIICLGLLVGLVFSHELWFPVNRTFPGVAVLIEAPIWVEWLLSTILVTSLILIVFSIRPKLFLITVITSLILLIFFDQMRLQPWVYQYLLLLIVLALRDSSTEDELYLNRTLGSAQLIIAGLYLWSGLQKLNFTFSHQTLSFLLEPWPNVLPSETVLVFFGLSLALLESFVGIGLIFRKTRKLSVYLAMTMHAVILTLLIAKNYNSIVWIWNLTLMALVIIAFWQNKVSFLQMMKNGVWEIKAAEAVVTVSLLLPVLSFAGWWDMYLSGALYSGNVEIGVIHIDENVFEKLPTKAKETVFRTKSTNEQMLPLLEWALNDLNVTVYPEKRVFKHVARQVCQLTNDSSKIELIVKERPAILDDSYQVTRISCAELEQ